MFPKTPFRKTLLLVGGSGELGTKLTYRFTQTWLKRWNVFNIDCKPNPYATYNYIVDLNQDEPFNQENMKKMKSEMAKFADGIDAYINVAGVDRKQALTASISDGTAIFEEYERIRKTELLSSLLMTHLAAAPRELPKPDKHSGIVPEITASLSFAHPDAYICFNGAM